MIQLTEEQLEMKQQLTLYVLKGFITFCTQHKLRYYAAFGTALGAIRHQGFIPWDDDVDVFMPRPDYEKFIILAKENLAKEYKFLIPEKTECYYCTFLKMALRDSTVMEASYYRCNIGISVDIFPIDGVGIGAPDERLLEKASSASVKYTIASSYYSLADYEKLSFKESAGVLILQLFRKYTKNLFLYKFNRICKKYSFDNSEYLTSFSYNGGIKEVFLKKWIGEGRKVKFEDTTITVFSEVEKYLTQTYGDYLTLPPKNERVTHHSYFKIDFTNRL